jgi:hypothetical protein|tara:strand:+ start:4798 stop:4989 length:192 start_codon:yes stop_codon:yes gene_type:complete
MYNNNNFIPIGKFGLRDLKNPVIEEKKIKKKPTVEREKDNKNEDKYNKFVDTLHKKQNKRDIK